MPNKRKKKTVTTTTRRKELRIKRKHPLKPRKGLAPPERRKRARRPYTVRETQPEDFAQIIEICRRVYTNTGPWNEADLRGHHERFPEGQLVAVDQRTGRIAGMCASLIVKFDDYEPDMNWVDFTARGTFSNHDREGETLYGAEIMVNPKMQRQGIGKRLYTARRELAQRLGLLRIRAGARLIGYSHYEKLLTPEEYVVRVLQRRLHDPTLTFQIKEGFRPMRIVRGYLPNDPESRGVAALIEWLNPKAATKEHYQAQRAAFLSLSREQ